MFALRRRRRWRRLLRARRSHRPRAAAEQGREPAGPGAWGGGGWGGGEGREGRREANERRRRPRPSRKGLRPRRRRGWPGRAQSRGGGAPGSVPCAGGGTGGGGGAGLQHVRLAVAAALCVALTRPPAPSRTGPHWPGRLAGGPLCRSPLLRQQDGGSDRSARRAGHPGTARASERFLRPAPPPARARPRPRAPPTPRATGLRRELSRRRRRRWWWSRLSRGCTVQTTRASGGALCCHRAPGRTSPPTATANKARSRTSERVSERVQAPKLPAATSFPPPPPAGGPAPAQLHGLLRLCAGKDTHADLEEALSSLRGLGSRTLTLRFLNPVVFVLGGSAALIHFPRVLTTCRTLLLPLLAACVKNESFFPLQRPHFLEWRGQALERLMVTVRGPESSDWKFGKPSRRK